MPQKYGPLKLESKKRNDRKLKIEVLTHYGDGKLECIKCGFDDVRALCIDHINGNGNQHRKSFANGSGGTPTYRLLRRQGYPKGFQTLCYNCNQIKKIDNKECRCYLSPTQIAFL